MAEIDSVHAPEVMDGGTGFSTCTGSYGWRNWIQYMHRKLWMAELDSVHAPEVMDGRTAGLGTIFVVYQTFRSARLPGGRLQEFYSISELSIVKHTVHTY
jgi:hypothetical protein